jgi:hypothetical protein
MVEVGPPDIRGRPNFGSGFGFGAESKVFRGFGGLSVSAEVDDVPFGKISVSAESADELRLKTESM